LVKKNIQLSNSCFTIITEHLKHVDLGKYSIVVMPDFFIDRIIRLKSIKDFLEKISEKERVGGGSIRDISIDDVKGGNAVNIAYCLANLGMNVTLFTIANRIGTVILTSAFSKFDSNKVKLKIAAGKHGHTAVIEFLSESASKVNVMLNDLGDIANFGPDRIDNVETREILQNADAVMVVNWGSNLKGTELAEYAFKKSPYAIHMIDPADIELRKYEFKNDLNSLADSIHFLSINENECNSLLTSFGLDSYQLIDIDKDNKDDYQNIKLKNAVTALSNKIGVNIAVHTRIGSAWSNGIESLFVPSFRVEHKTLTGAGDSWDSAYIVGHLIGLPEEKKLMFSNAFASLHISSSSSESLNMGQIADFLKHNK
jgi:ribokinase